MIFNYYSSCVISARLNEQIIKMNDSLNELAKSGLKVASESMNYFEFLIKVRRHPNVIFLNYVLFHYFTETGLGD